MIDFRENYDKVVSDLLRPVYITRSFKRWFAFLIAGLLLSILAYLVQLKLGLGVTGLRDITTWGLYIGTFVFFVATSLIGMLITAVLGLLGVRWATPLTRMSEIIALGFAAVAGLVIIIDMGRPDRLLNVFIHGRFQSPILWDLTVVITYTVISALLLYLPLIPDLKLCAERLEKAHPLQRRIYALLSMDWKGLPQQEMLISRGIRILSVMIIPMALAIHTVTSWLFAVTMRPGWDSTIFGPYFVTGAFVSGTSAVLIAMYFFRTSYRLKEYITELHFDKISKLLVLVSLVYLYFNINEFLVLGYKLKKFDLVHLEALFSGHYAPLFWGVQLLGLVIPIILLILKPFRKPLPAFIIALFVLAGSYLKRYLIVVPTMEHPFLPVQHLPLEFKIYTPTLIEITITAGTLFLVLIIITVLAKFLPIIPIWEMVHKSNPEKEH